MIKYYQDKNKEIERRKKMKDQKNIQEWSKYNPKSVCYCGHTGDGGQSQHADNFQHGHGSCLVRGCDCKQFTWAGWTDKTKKALELQ